MEELRGQVLSELGNAPKKKHPQCKIKLRAGKRCTFYCVEGTDFCKRHQYGNIPFDNQLGVTHDDANGNTIVGKRIVPYMAFFKHRCGPKLQELLESALSVQSHDISEEIALVRASTVTQVEMFNAITEMMADPEIMGQVKTPEALEKIRQQAAICGASMRAAMNDITFQVERQAKIQSMIADKISPGAIQDVVRQMNKMVFECFCLDKDGNERPDAAEFLEKFDKKLNEELRLPSMSPNGEVEFATVTPNDQVKAMDATIPYVPWEDNDDDKSNDAGNE